MRHCQRGAYSVHLDAGALSDGQGRLNKEVLPEDWQFTVEPYGVTSMTVENDLMQVEGSYEFEVVLDGVYADRAEILCDSDYVSCDTDMLTESGTVTLTATAASNGPVVPFEIVFYKGNEALNVYTALSVIQ